MEKRPLQTPSPHVERSHGLLSAPAALRRAPQAALLVELLVDALQLFRILPRKQAPTLGPLPPQIGSCLGGI